MQRSLKRIVEEHCGILHAQLTCYETCVASDAEGFETYNKQVFLPLPFGGWLSLINELRLKSAYLFVELEHGTRMLPCECRSTAFLFLMAAI